MATGSMLHHRQAARSRAYSLGALVLVIATATILGALAFEHVGKYLPCPLCLQQRYAYYAGIPLTFLAMVLVSSGHRGPAALLFGLVAAGFAINAGLGVYQSGAEWGWWPGPQTCGTVQTIGGGTGGLLDKLDTTKVIRCDEAQWRFALLSFAGWNAVVSAFLALAAARAAFASTARD